MMKTITKIKNSKALVTLVWVLGLLVIWEIFAFIIQATKRTPENIMPHVWQIFYSLIDPKPVSNGMSCLQVVLFNAGQTLSRAGQGFMIGTLIGFALAILMKLSHIVEKIAAPMAITASILVDTLQGDGGLGCMLSQSLKHAMSIYVFWDIVVFSAVIGVLSCSLMGWIENAVSPLKRIERKTKKKKEAA